VVITGANLVAPAQKWNLDYLAQNIGQGDFTVYFSRNHVFKYYDDKKLKEFAIDFTAPTRRVDMKFPEFVRYVKQWKHGDERYAH
jgi:hypoxia-inducible factor 1-alpha inhibitor (HIF hydroxylase)